MFDEMERLRASEELQQLLAHYVRLVQPDRQAWQDRVMELGAANAAEVVRWHGELIAYGWLEQNTGMTPVLRPGTVPACYRVTTAGLRALKALHAEAANA